MAQASTTANRPKNKVRVDVTRADVSEIKIVDTDLVLTLKDGRKLYVNDGAIQSMMDQEFAVEFADGSTIVGQELLQSAGAADIGRVAVTSAQDAGGEPVVAQAPPPVVAGPAQAPPPAKSGGFKSWLAIGTPLVGGLLGGVMGGGGAAAGATGGTGTDGGASPTPTATKTATPVISAVTSDDKVSGTEKSAGITVSGLAEANATVTIVWGATSKTATASASGAWSTTFAAGEVPSDAQVTTLVATAKTSTGTASDPTSRAVQVDTTPPGAPLVNIIAGNDVISPNEKATGVIVAGTAEAGSAVTVTWGSATKTVAADIVGNWSVSFAAGEVPAAGSYTISATASDGLGNTSSAGTRPISVSPAVTVEGVITAGPVIPGNGLSVDIYTGSGALVVAGVTVAADGTFVAPALPLTPGEVVVVRVVDKSSTADYNDEATNQPKDLNANLFAVAVVDGTNLTVNVNPLTTIAAIKAGLAADGSGTLTSATAVNNARDATAQAFGLSGIDLVKLVPQPTNGGAYNPADGLSNAERLGSILAALSGVDQQTGGDTQAAITAVVGGLTVSGSAGSLNEAAAAAVIAGALVADAATPGALSTIVSDALAVASGNQVTIAALTADNVITANEAATLVITGTAPAGASAVTVEIGGASFAATLGERGWSYALKPGDLALMGADGPKIVKATATLANATTVSATRPIILNAALPATPTILPVATNDIVNRAERDAGVTVSGTAPAGATVSIVLGGLAPKTVVSSETGSWSIDYTAEELPTAGNVAVVATAIDSFGNTSLAQSRTVSFQTTIPAPPSISTVAGDNLIGPIERAGNVVVSGTGAPGGRVTLTWGSLERTVNVDAAGAWSTSFTPSQLPDDGEYVLQAVTTDVAGNVSAPENRTVIVDGTPPAPPSIAAVATDNIISRNEKNNGVTVRGTSEANASIEITWGAVTRTVKANATGSWSAVFSQSQVPSDGTYTITAIATDSSNNVSQPQQRLVTVDTSNLPPTISSIGTGSTINAAQKTAGVVVAGTAEAGANVTVTFGAATRSTIANAVGGWNVTFSGGDIPDASSATVVARSTDPAQNQSDATTRTVDVDTVAPGKPVINVVSDDDQIGTGDFLNPLQVSGTAEANSTVTVTWGLSAPKQTTSDSGGNWTVSFNNSEKPGDGLQNIVARVTDAAGNTSDPELRPILVDTVASPPVINQVAGNDVIGLAERNSGVIVSGTSDPNADITVTWNNIQKVTKASGTGLWTVDYGSGEIPVTGTTQINARSVDTRGNVSNAVPRQVTVDTVASAPTINAVSVDNLIGQGEVANGITVTGTAEPGAAVTVTWAGAERVTSADSNGVWSVIFDSASVPADGLRPISAQAVDIGGNASSVVNLPVTIDRAKPGKPTIDIVATDDRINAAEKAAAGGVAVSGTAEPNATVVVNWGAATRTVTADASGAWTASFASADINQEGAIGITASQFDRAGNSSDPETRIVTVDTIAPPPPTIDPVTGNNIVNANERNAGVIITGVANPGAPVNVTWGTVSLPATADPVTGVWSVEFQTSQIPADGNYTIRATQRDAAGNVSADRELGVTVETGTSQATTIDDVSGNNLINSTERALGVTVTGTASSNAQVAVNWNGVTRNVTANAAGAWSAAFGPSEIPASGTSTITATATTLAGNTGLPAVKSVTVDQDAPLAPTINTVAGNDIVNSSEKSGNIVVSGSGEPGAEIRLTWGGEEFTDIRVDANGIWSVTIPSAKVPTDGSRPIRATQTDAAGNTGAERELNVTIDTVAPGAPTISNVSGDNRINAVEKGSNLTISGTAEANATVTVTFGTVTKTAVASGSGAWSVTLLSGEIPGDNSYTLSATQRDAAGNQGTATGTRAVTVDTIAPNAPVISTVSAGALVSGTEKAGGVTVSGTVQTGTTGVSVTWGGITRAATVSGTSWSYTFTNAEIPVDGTYGITAVGTDAAGNVGATSVPTVVTVDTTAPTLAPVIATVAGDNRVNAGERPAGVTVSGTAEANASVTVTWGSVSKTAAANASGDWSASFASGDIPLAEGNSTITATQTDAAGNAGTAVGTQIVTIDTIAPSLPVILGMSNNYAGTAFTTDRSKVRVAGTGEAGSTVTVFVDGVSAGTVTVDGKGFWLSPELTISGGSAVVTARQTDSAGNISGLTAGQTISKQSVAGTAISFAAANWPAGSGFAIYGGAASDQLRSARMGDFNNDGLIDVIAGAFTADDGALADTGAAYIVFGKPGGSIGTLIGTGSTARIAVDVSAMTPADGVTILGENAGDQLGREVSAIGDVNGDGITDMVIGAHSLDVGASADVGRVYVLFGKPSTASWGTLESGRAVLRLANLTPSEGFIIQGASAGDLAGYSVSDAGDVNGDGHNDFIVGAERGRVSGSSSSGDSYIIFGKPAGGTWGSVDATGRQVINVTNLSPNDGFIITGDAANDYAGTSVSKAGDINGDGIGDLIVGARFGDDGGADAGEAYVILGKSGGGWGTLDAAGRRRLSLSSLGPNDGFILQGAAPTDQTGFSVGSAGDVNGDGIADLLVGASRSDSNGNDSGAAYVIFGKLGSLPGTIVGSRRVLNLATLSSNDGFVLVGDNADDLLGISVSGAGDANGDGVADFVITAVQADRNPANSLTTQDGKAYLIFGKAGFGWNTTADGAGRQVLDVGNLSVADGITFFNVNANDNTGSMAHGGSDLNGDGVSDFLVTSFGSDPLGRANGGIAYAVFGKTSWGGLSLTATAGTDFLVGGDMNDSFDAIGASDSAFGLSGNDTFTITTAALGRIDGGAGTDTLSFNASGLALNLTSLAAGTITGIERLDIRGFGTTGNTLTITRETLLALSDTSDTLLVNLDSNDTVNASGFTTSGSTQTINGVAYTVYTSGSATLLVQAGVGTVLTPPDAMGAAGFMLDPYGNGQMVL